MSSNQDLRDLVGYTKEELLQLDWRDLMVPEEIATAGRAVKEGPAMKAVRWHWCTKDGQVIAVTIASRKITFVDDDGSIRDVYMALVIVIDGQAVLSAQEAFPSK